MSLDAGDRTLFAFRKNLVVAASAGTGKTHRLTALYAFLALGVTSMGQPDERIAADALEPERIVATTFSRAAAREIARRAERALAAIADGGAHPFEEELAARAADLGGLDASEVRARAKKALASFGQARIDTLHGVARRIVARHAFALGQPEGARVLEEDELGAIGASAVDAALGDALEAGGARAEAARAVIASCSGVVAARRRLLVLFDRLDEEGLDLDELALVDHAGEAAEATRRLLRVARQSAVSGCAKSRAPASALFRALDAAKTTGDPFPLSGLAPLLDLLSVRLPREPDRSAADQDLDALRAELPGKTHAGQAEHLAAWLREVPRLGPRERAVLALLADARARLAADKRRAGGLGFGDLLRVARDALRNRPDVAEATRAAVGALLVDELQDTSAVQKDLVYLLREKAGSDRAPGERPSPEHLEGHGLFLVGDRKQSIYGFRGADVAVFARACAELGGREAERALALPTSSGDRAPIADFVALSTSRRSGGRVLAFVNAFAELDFSGDRPAGKAPRAFEIVYGPGEHLGAVAGREAEGAVTVVRDDGASPAGADPLVAGARGVARQAHVAAAAVALEVAAGSAPRDVAVLARRRSTIPLVELALGRLGVPYVVAGRALYDTSEVRDAAALVRLLLDPRDRLAQATVLRGPAVALSDASLAALSSRGVGLHVGLGRGHKVASRVELPRDERARLDVFAARFADLRPALLGLTPGDALRLAVRSFELERVIAALPRAEARLANLDRLVALARRRGGTLAGFSRWLDQRIDDDADEPEAAVFSAEDDAVRLTTIHGSKGLDFPTVVLVDLDAEPRPEASTLGFFHGDDGATGARFVMKHHAARPGSSGRVPSTEVLIITRALEAAQTEARAREAAERRRLTYVAITRARTRLVLVGAVDGGRPRPGSAWRALAGALDRGALDASIVTTARARDLLADAAALPPRANAAPDAEVPVGRPPVAGAARTVSIATTPLALFGGCARRFRLRYLVGLEEPVERGEVDLDDDAVFEAPAERDAEPPDDPRALGRAAHRVLERWPERAFGEPTDPRDVEQRLAALGPAAADAPRVARAISRFLSGPYAAAIRAGGAAIGREIPFALALAIDEGATPGPRELVLRGAIDLVVRWPDGRVDVLDYKLAAPGADLARHAFQLRAYALAAARAEDDVAVAALHLFGNGSPAWLAPGDVASSARVALASTDRAAFARELGALARRFAAARQAGRFDPIARPACVELGCGFLPACHGADAAAPREHQLGLFDG